MTLKQEIWKHALIDSASNPDDFVRGAQWMYEKMIKDAVDSIVAEGGMCPSMESIPILTNTDMILLPKDRFKVGDKVKLLVIKEE